MFIVASCMSIGGGGAAVDLSIHDSASRCRHSSWSQLVGPSMLQSRLSCLCCQAATLMHYRYTVLVRLCCEDYLQGPLFPGLGGPMGSQPYLHSCCRTWEIQCFLREKERERYARRGVRCPPA